MNALSGLTGYMTLGLGAKAKPAVVQVAPSKVLLAKDGTLLHLVIFGASHTWPGQGFFLDSNSKLSTQVIEWPAPPEEIGEQKHFFANLQLK